MTTLMGEQRLATQMNKPNAMDESEIIGEDSQALEDDDESYVEKANKSISNVDINPSIAPSHMTFANPDQVNVKSSGAQEAYQFSNAPINNAHMMNSELKRFGLRTKSKVMRAESSRKFQDRAQMIQEDNYLT